MFTIKRLCITHEGRNLVDLSLAIDGATGLVGASGSGKSLTLKALLGLLPSSMRATLQTDAPFEPVRGQSVGFVPQNPFTALSPMSPIGTQFHAPKTRAIALLERVGLGAWTLNRFAAELSGGQLQRAIIAMALAQNPRLLLLDEPTTALDSESKESVLALLRQIRAEEGVLMLFVAHDMAAVAGVCDRVCVIDAGRIVESGALNQVLQNPAQPYTRQLIESNFAYREWRS